LFSAPIPAFPQLGEGAYNGNYVSLLPIWGGREGQIQGVADRRSATGWFLCVTLKEKLTLFVFCPHPGLPPGGGRSDNENYVSLLPIWGGREGQIQGVADLRSAMGWFLCVTLKEKLTLFVFCPHPGLPPGGGRSV